MGQTKSKSTTGRLIFPDDKAEKPIEKPIEIVKQQPINIVKESTSSSSYIITDSEISIEFTLELDEPYHKLNQLIKLLNRDNNTPIQTDSIYDNIRYFLQEKDIMEIVFIIKNSSYSCIKSMCEEIIVGKLQDQNIDSLCALLKNDSNDQIVEYIIEELVIKIKNVPLHELTSIWTNYSYDIIKNIKNKPELSVKLRMHELPDIFRIRCIEQLGVIIFNIHREDALALLNNSLHKISKLLYKENRYQSDYFGAANFNKETVKKQGYAALSRHHWGMAVILFKKAGHNVGVKNVIEQYAPEYIKKLFFY